MTGQPNPRVTIIDHPLVSHKVSRLRDVKTSSAEFRLLCHQITTLIAYEALGDLPTRLEPVETPLETAHVPVLDGHQPAVVGILRAGLVMVEAILGLIPDAKIGHIGLSRDPDTHKPVDYYTKLPADIAERQVLLVDPMLATGGSAVRALDVLKEVGCSRIHLVSILGCPQGVAAVHQTHSDVSITMAAQDQTLNDNAYIVPGLGDAGDRIYGTQ